MRSIRSLALVLGLLASSGSALASPPSPAPPAPAVHATPQAAAAQVRPRATQILTEAERSAVELRSRANPEAVHAAQTKAVRHDVATQIVGARRELRKTTASLGQARTDHAAASAAVEKTEAEQVTAQAKVAQAKASAPWLARMLGTGLTKNAREKLGRYEEEKAAYEVLAGRLEQEKHHVGTLAAHVKGFEDKRTSLALTLGTARSRDWKAESKQATTNQLAALTAEADKVEADAKQEIHTLVRSYVGEKYSLHRLPVANAHAAAEGALGAANHADSQLSSADSALGSLSSAVSQKQMNATMEAALGENAMTNALETLNQFDISSKSNTAQNRVQDANAAVAHLNAKVTNLRAMTAKLQLGTGGLEGQAARVDADVATVALVDLALSMTSLDTPLMDIAMAGMEQYQVASASQAVSRTRASVREIREGVRAVHAKLGAHLRGLDADAAKVVDQAVAELVAAR